MSVLADCLDEAELYEAAIAFIAYMELRSTFIGCNIGSP
jgi:hypothetical protein